MKYRYLAFFSHGSSGNGLNPNSKNFQLTSYLVFIGMVNGRSTQWRNIQSVFAVKSKITHKRCDIPTVGTVLTMTSSGSSTSLHQPQIEMTSSTSSRTSQIYEADPYLGSVHSICLSRKSPNWTGSGKTLAFALSILQKSWNNPQPYFALFFAPTREQAFQTSQQFESGTGVNSVVVVGGQEMVPQQNNTCKTASYYRGYTWPTE